MKNLVVEYLATDAQSSNHRTKRGVLNFMREISKLLFGTLTQADVKSYSGHEFQELEKEIRNVNLLNEHLRIV